MKLFPYKSVIFDCDGVLLNSNQIKTDAFYQTVLPYGENIAKLFAEYHKKNGGISRNKKFEYFLKNMVPSKKIKLGLTELLNNYASTVFNALSECEVCEGLEAIRKQDPEVKWFVISGGNELEIKRVFKEKKISRYFDGGIFGSPRSKDHIFQMLINESNIQFPAIYLGDSRYDHEVASKHLVDFLFLYGWTEFKGWQNYCVENSIDSIKKVSDLTNYFNTKLC